MSTSQLVGFRQTARYIGVKSCQKIGEKDDKDHKELEETLV